MPGLFGRPAGQDGGVSRVEIALGEGLVGRIVAQAVAHALQLVQAQEPGIDSAGAAQAREDYANGGWSLR